MRSELARRIAFTIGALLVYRLGTHILLPGIDPSVWAQFFRPQDAGLLGGLNAAVGGAIERLAIFALGLTPYISAAIIVQLLSFFVGQLRALKNSGEEGRRKLESATRWLTFALAAFQAYGIAVALQGIRGLVAEPGALFLATATLTLAGGTLFLVWLCDQITQRGIGNGVALILSTGIVLQLPGGILDIIELKNQGLVSGDLVTGLALLSLVLVVCGTFFERARRRERVDFSMRADGGAQHVGTAYLSFKLNGAGIIPALVASWLMVVPVLLASYFSRWDPMWWSDIVRMFDRAQPLYMICYGLIVFVCVYLYTAFVLDPEDAAEKLKRHGGTIPRVEPGEATAIYLDRVVSRTTLYGAIYFVAICLIPELVLARAQVPFFLTGTSLLILVCTVLDVESQARQLARVS